MNAARPVCVLILILIATLALAGCRGVVVTRPTDTPRPELTPTPTMTVAVVVQTPTATPDTYTPPPTATPTITPEPIFYRIQPGDNLFIIASRFEVPHDLLRDVNGIEDERALQVGQLLIIPQGDLTEPFEPTATFTPTPLPVAVENVYFHPSPLGELTVLGEVRNASNVDLERVLVQITLFDEADRPLASGSAYPLLDVTAPGQRAPFAVRFAEAPARYATYEPQILSAVPAYVQLLHRELAPVEVVAQQAPGEPLRLDGRLLNAGAAEAVAPLVVVTAYDGLGRVVGARSVAPDGEVVASGSDVPFHVEIVPAGNVLTYTVQSQARRLTP